MTATWEIRAEGALHHVEGELAAPDAARFAACLAALDGEGPAVLEMQELELLDGVSVAEAVNGLRALARRRGAVRLRHAPQMLAHTLYKRGLLIEEPLVLESPRHDEGYGVG